MIITPTVKGTFVAFQACVNAGKKVGFVCEADTLTEAIEGAVDQVSKYCNINNIHPAHNLEGAAQ